MTDSGVFQNKTHTNLHIKRKFHTFITCCSLALLEHIIGKSVWNYLYYFFPLSNLYYARNRKFTRKVFKIVFEQK